MVCEVTCTRGPDGLCAPDGTEAEWNEQAAHVRRNLISSYWRSKGKCDNVLDAIILLILTAIVVICIVMVYKYGRQLEWPVLLLLLLLGIGLLIFTLMSFHRDLNRRLTNFDNCVAEKKQQYRW